MPRRTAVTPQLAGASVLPVRCIALIAIAVFIGSLAACSQAGEPDQHVPSPTALISPGPTTAPTLLPSEPASPIPSAVAKPGGLEIGRIAEIVTTDLVMRSLPEVSEASVIDSYRVPIGFLAFVVDGPVAADGYHWYKVAPFPPTMNDVVESHPKFGWVAAAGKGGEPWVAAWDGQCPPANLDGMMLWQRYIALSCFGGSDITLEGELRCRSDGEPSGEPAWLWLPRCRVVGDYGDLLAGGMATQLAPGVELTATDGAQVRITGHLSDPAADACVETPFPGVEPTDPELVRLRCRLTFVATEITEL